MDTALRIVIIVSAIFYYVAALFYGLQKKKVAYILNGIGFAANLSLVIINWVVNGYVPFISMYQVMTFVGACFTVSYLYMHFVNKDGWMGMHFNLCSGIVMTGVFFMSGSASLIWRRVPALQSVYFIPHVLFYMLAYTLFAVSFVICMERLLFAKDDEKKRRLDKGVYDVVRLAFPFATTAMLLGAVWANEVWGQFWSWDDKENWALITWLMYAIYLHCYRNEKLRKVQYIFIILGLLALVMTMFGVSYFGSGVHAYS